MNSLSMIEEGYLQLAIGPNASGQLAVYASQAKSLPSEIHLIIIHLQYP